MTERLCSKCRVTKPLSEFGTDRRKYLGKESRCLTCVGERRRKRRSDLASGLAAKRQVLTPEERRSRNRQSFVLCKAKNPKREAAVAAVFRAIRAGRMRREPCQECGNPRSEGHHPDYDQPLSVLWLCRKHHLDWHRANGPGKNRDPDTLVPERMTMNKTQKRIWDAYVACERLCESDRDADAWFRRSFESARSEEQRHRQAGKRFTGGQAGYKLPVADAARFFAVKWFLDPMSAPGSYAEACALRADVLLALGARDRVREDKLKNATWLRLCSEYQDVRGLDYSEVFAA
jgi:hypothetical protein